MKKLLLVVIALIFGCGVALAAEAAKGTFAAKAGDTIYVCGCGEGCDCGTIASKEGACACGKKLVKTTVTKVADGKAYYMLDGKELSASLTGAYACGCPKCNCNTISQKAGKCGCGKKLVKVAP